MGRGTGGRTRCGREGATTIRVRVAPADQAELQLFEVAQAAVEHLRRPARRPRRDVAGPDQRHPQPRVVASSAAPTPTTPPPTTTTSNCFAAQPLPRASVVPKSTPPVHRPPTRYSRLLSLPRAKMAGVARSSGYVPSIDQGTTSSRAILFDHRGRPVDPSRSSMRRSSRKPGWVERRGRNLAQCGRVTAAAMASAEVKLDDVMACGITNQRETTVGGDRRTGVPCTTRSSGRTPEPQHCASAWRRRRSRPVSGADRTAVVHVLRRTEIGWLLENVDGVRERAEAGDLCFGTTDSWFAWNMTGGVNGGLPSPTSPMRRARCSWTCGRCSGTNRSVPTSVFRARCRRRSAAAPEVYGELRSPARRRRRWRESSVINRPQPSGRH